MGYTAGERLLRVELPLAVPLIIAGIRLASVTTIGLATVASVLGDAFGGLGQFITEGLQTLLPDEVPARRGPVGAGSRSPPTSCSSGSSAVVTPWAHAKAGAR